MKATNPSNEDRDHSIPPNDVHDGDLQREPYVLHLGVPSRSNQRLPNHRVVVQDRIGLLQLNQSHTTVRLPSMIFENNLDDRVPISKVEAMSSGICGCSVGIFKRDTMSIALCTQPMWAW